MNQLITGVIVRLGNDNFLTIDRGAMHRGTKIASIEDESTAEHTIYTVYNVDRYMVDRFIDIPLIVRYEHRKYMYEDNEESI